MGKVKQRTRKGYIGRRKQTSKIRSRKEVNEEEREKFHTAGCRDGEGQEDSRTPTTEKPQPVSASEKKFQVFGIEVNVENIENDDEERNDRENGSDSDCYIITQTSLMSQLISGLLCPECCQPGVKFTILDDKKCGFSLKGQLKCSNCQLLLQENYLCQRNGQSFSSNESFDINTRAILAFRGVGCGYSAIKKWCGIMNMPYSLSKNGYALGQQRIETASSEAFEEITRKSRPSIIAAYKEIEIEPDDQGILNISVSYDGSWHKRGYSSHNGMASVIDLLTGIPIDYEVLSNFCLKCKIASGKPEDPDWKAKHAPNCPKNFDGSAGAMEVECARRIWGRSVENLKYRYTTMLSDGDSKAYDAIVASKVYGENVKIEKADCINHVSKRMGTALRKIVEVSKGTGASLSGKGKLTQEKITRIQNYYGKAIKDNNSDIVLLKKRIMGILMHLSSTDSNPMHMHCPPGKKSYCFWQRATSNGIQPGCHSEHETLHPEIGKRLVPIFKRLSDEKLLKRCSGNMTQNSNESFHNLIWTLCPKARFVGRKTINTAVALAACQFSMGLSFTVVLCKILNMQPGENLLTYKNLQSKQRIQLANCKSRDEAKKRRKQLKFHKSTKEHKKKKSEGETYSSGAFDY